MALEAERIAPLDLELPLDRRRLRPHVADDEDVVDEHLGTFADGERYGHVRAVLAELGPGVDGGALVPEILIRELKRVAVHGELSRHIRRAWLQRHAPAKGFFRHRLVACERHAVYRRAHALGDDRAHGHRHLGRRRSRRDDLDPRTHFRGGEPAPVVEVLDHLDVRVQPGGRERLAVAQPQAGREFGQRHRRVARDLERRHLELLAACHGEGDDQLAVRDLAGMRRLRIAIPLRPQMLFDAVARVLEQILVDRALPLDRDQFGALVRRQRIAGEHDAHARPRRDRQRQVRDQVPLAEAHRGDDLRFVVAALAALLGIALDARAERLALVRRAGRQPEAIENFGALGRRPQDLHRADPCPRTRIDREDERRPFGVVLDLGTRRDRRAQVAALAQRVSDDARHVRRRG